LPWLGARLGIDATRKERFRSIAPEFGMDDATKRQIEERWREYGF
jgi:3-polyprenyl-4-hydroxybenzoate decarboxylase